MGESTKVTTIIRTIGKFDGSPGKYWDWKRSTRAIIGLASKSIAKIMDGQLRPTAIYEDSGAATSIEHNEVNAKARTIRTTRTSVTVRTKKKRKWKK